MPAPSPARPPRRIARWKIVGGAFVHFALPVYVLAAAADALRIGATMTQPQAAAIVPGVLRDSMSGLAIYAGLALVATGLAAIFDRVARWGSSDGDPLAVLLARAHGRFGGRADAALGQLALVSNRDDPRMLALAQHCEALLTASLQAIETAPADRRDTIAIRTAEALESLAREAHDLAAAAGAAHDEQAATLARFVATRYGATTLDRPSDSAGDAP